MCIFCKIVAGEAPCDKVFENEDFIVIKDINPQAPIHLLAIPKEHYADITELDDNRAKVVGSMLKIIGEKATEWGLEDGFRIISNKGRNGCQTVSHLHIQILGGRLLSQKMC
ncbi:MAG: histidine triad nucleotide-binding protein [Clostridia bacterium]